MLFLQQTNQINYPSYYNMSIPGVIANPARFGGAACYMQGMQDAADIRINLRDPSKFFQFFSRATLRFHSRYVNVQDPRSGQVSGTAKYSPYDAAAACASNVYMRGQMLDMKRAQRWEALDMQDNPTHRFMNYGLFPTVHSQSQGKDRPPLKRLLTYAVIYTNFPLEQNPNSPSFSNGGQLVAFKPNYKRLKLSADLLPDGMTPNDYNVHLDTTLLGDNNCLAAILAAANNSFMMPESYLTFVPLSNEDSEYNTGVLATPEGCKIYGSSLGASVFLTVCGWQPWYATGYLKYILPSTVIDHSYVVRAGLKNQGNGDKNPYFNTLGFSPQQINPSGYKGLSLVAKQFDFVETVDQLLLKAAYCVGGSNPCPFFMPAKDDWGKSLPEYFRTLYKNESAVSWYPVLRSVYTPADGFDGRPMLYVDGNNKLLKTLLCGFTISEWSIMQSQMTWALASGPSGLDSAIVPTLTAQIHNYAGRENVIRQNRNVRKKAMKELKANVIAGRITSKDFYGTIKGDQKKNEAARVAAAKQRAANVSIKGDKKALAALVDKAEQQYTQWLIETNWPKLTKEQRKALGEQIKAPKALVAAAKKELGIGLGTEIAKAILPNYAEFLPKRKRGGSGYKLLHSRLQKVIAHVHQLTNGQMSQAEAEGTAAKILGFKPETMEKIKNMAAATPAQVAQVEQQQEQILAGTGGGDGGNQQQMMMMNEPQWDDNDNTAEAKRQLQTTIKQSGKALKFLGKQRQKVGQRGKVAGKVLAGALGSEEQEELMRRSKPKAVAAAGGVFKAVGKGVGSFLDELF